MLSPDDLIDYYKRLIDRRAQLSSVENGIIDAIHSASDNDNIDLALGLLKLTFTYHKFYLTNVDAVLMTEPAANDYQQWFISITDRKVHEYGWCSIGLSETYNLQTEIYRILGGRFRNRKNVKRLHQYYNKAGLELDPTTLV